MNWFMYILPCQWTVDGVSHARLFQCCPFVFDQIHGLKQDLEEERLQRGILDGKLKDQLQSLQEVGRERDEQEREALLVKETLVASKQEVCTCAHTHVCVFVCVLEYVCTCECV